MELVISKKSMFFRPIMRLKIITVMTRLPQMSMGLTSSSLVLGILAKPAARMKRQMGTLIKKMKDHWSEPKRSRMPLQAAGPRMLATPYMPPTMPSAMPRFSSGKAVPTSAVATGITPPAPIAWIARARMSISKLPVYCESPHSSEPAPKSRMQMR